MVLVPPATVGTCAVCPKEFLSDRVGGHGSEVGIASHEGDIHHDERCAGGEVQSPAEGVHEPSTFGAIVPSPAEFLSDSSVVRAVLGKDVDDGCLGVDIGLGREVG